MPTYYDSQNNARVLTERIGSGGEGTVYFCEDSDLVGKIYHEPITEEKAGKLRWMAAHKNDRLLKVAAWTVDVLCDAPDGRVVGFLMPNVKAKEIHELYSLKSRRVHFPEATWHFLVHTAGNVARAFYNLHKDNHVMGDVNHGNCVVLADGTVKLIDCDSYSVKTDELRYRCEVGVGTHLAPELQGVNLRDAERLEKHDNFGLAVIIFQLLFLGRHPFAGNYLGAEDKSIEDCIRELRFAYGDDAEFRKVKQPPGTLPLAAVSPRLALMFERAFITEDRPEPREWIEALADLSVNLEQCALHPGHLYFNGLAACPWCEIEAQTGLMLFPFITAGNHLGDDQPFNIFTVESLIANLGIGPTALAKLPAPPEILPPPTPQIVAAKEESRKMMFISTGVQFGALVVLMLIFGVGIAFFLGMASMMFWLIYLNNSSKFLHEEVREDLVKAEQEWASFESQWQQNAPSPELDGDLANIRKKIGDYQIFQQTNVRQSKILHDEYVGRPLRQFLMTAPLANAQIKGVRETQIESLRENGFETAADLDANQPPEVKGVGERTIAKLLEWRKEIAKNFDATEFETAFKVEQNKLTAQTAGARRGIEREIEQLLGSLRSGSVNLRRRRQQLSVKTAELAKQLGQCRSNAQTLGTNAPTFIGLILITVFTPYLGFMVEQATAPHNVSTISTYPTAPTYSKEGNSGYSSTQTLAKNDPYQSATAGWINEDITDTEIALLSSSERAMHAGNLFKEAESMSSPYSDSINQRKVEAKLRLAVRLKGDDPRALDALGRNLYEQKRYAESLQFLKQSSKLGEENYDTKSLTGKNYLELKRFKEARDIFANLTRAEYPSSKDFYNLGLAHKGLKNYVAAEEAFYNSTVLGEGAAARYELGLCYHKLGSIEELKNEYTALLKINFEMAEKLREETSLIIMPPEREVIVRQE